MTSPQTNIESALAYASHDKEGLVVSPQYHLDQKNEHFEKLLSEVKSIDDLLVLQERLETDLPWFKLASDESVRDYFSRWNVRIENHSDLELFAAALSQRIADLAVSDSTAQKYQEEKKYRLQLRNLPAALSQFKLTQQSFDSLAGPLDILLQYVYKAVTEQGFSMNEEGATALEKYPGKITITPFKRNKTVVDLCLNLDKSSSDGHTRLFVHPIYQEREVITEGRTWYGKKITVTEIEITDQIERLAIYRAGVLNKDYTKEGQCIDSYLFEPSTGKKSKSPVRTAIATHYNYGGRKSYELCAITAQDFLQQIKCCAEASPDFYLPHVKTLLQTLFNLPKYMHNYTVKLNQKMKDIIDNLPNGE